MLRAFLLSFGQLGDPKIAGVFVKSVLVTVLLLGATGAALWFGFAALAERIGLGAGGIAGAVAVLAALTLGWLLFRAVAVGVMGVFADDVVVAVERRYYPAALATANDVPLARGIAMGLGSAGRAILVNVALSPVYVLLLVTGVGTWLVFFLVNGWLLGHDLGQMVAARHMDDAALHGWRASSGVERFALGVAGTALFMVPILNLAAPVLGAAMATHLFHRGRTT